MPEIYDSRKETISKHNGEKDFKKKYARLARKITDNVKTKIPGVKATDPEYWGLREVLTEDEVDMLLRMKLRKWYTYEQLCELNRSQFSPERVRELLDLTTDHGIIEYDYGDNYDDNGPTRPDHGEQRFRLSFFVPGSAELFNSTTQRVDKNPPVASFFERMTFLPLEDITAMVRPGGNGIGMHVIPVEKEISVIPEANKLEKISYWLKKYEGHLSAGICSCRYSRAVLGEGCTDCEQDWCIQVGDMADYAVETGKARWITKEEALEILQKAEDNGYVHQTTNIDGDDHIFDICNCNPQICNALRTSQLYNTPNMSKSAYTAHVDKEKCVACNRCVEYCPAGAIKLGQKFCDKNGKEIEYPKQPLPDKIRWGKYAWDENYRDTARVNTHKTGSSPCKAACPAHVPVQGYLQMAKEGRYDEALALIKRENPFPAICGRVCNKLCEDACTRGKVDKPVSIDEVKKFLAERDLHAETRYVPKKVINKVIGDWSDKKIAIIGAGPAGLSCAYYLASRGYSPTVFEKNARPGGMMTYGIPAYKLQKDVIEAEIDVIRELGVEIKCGVEVGKDITIQQLKDQGYKAFYIAIGCQGGRYPGVPGDHADGTDFAVNFLANALSDPDQKMDGKVVVVGGGNVAIDCARTAHRFFPESVSMYCLESRETMPASKIEISEAEEEEIKIEPGWGPKEVLTNEAGHVTGIVFKRCVSTIDPETGAFSPKYDENDTITVEADNIVFAIGQAIEWGGLLEGTGVTFGRGNYPAADGFTYQTADPSIFVGGDVFTGPKFVINAIGAGHEAAESLMRYVSDYNVPQTIGRDRRYFKALDTDNITIESYDEAGRQEPAVRAIEDPGHSFFDPRLVFTEEQVKTECSRCLSCGMTIVDENRCIGCGLCTTRCEFDAIHLRRDHPEMTDYRKAEDKITGLLSYAAPRAVKILLNSGSREARQMAEKRRAYKQDPTKPHTGNAVDINEMMPK